MTTPAPRAPSDIELQDPAFGQEAVAAVHIDRAAKVDPRGVIKSGRLAGLSMWAAIAVVAWPVLIENILNSMVGLVDTTLAAGLSEAATDAIGVAAYFEWLIGLVPIALGIGSTALIARAFGRNRLAVAGAALGQAMILSIILGSILALVLIAMAPQIARMMSLGEEPEAFRHAVDYLRIVSLGIPFSATLFACIAGCRGAGDTVKPMLVMLVINIVNSVSSFLMSGVDLASSRLDADGLVHKHVFLANPLELNWGVKGIALGTLLAWIVGAALMVAIMSKGTHGLKLRARRLRPHMHTIRRLLKVALPNMMESAGMWLGNVLIVVMVGWMHHPGLYGAHILAIRIESMSYLLGFAMAAASATLMGQYLGAGHPRLAQGAALRCMGVSVVVMGTLGLIFAIFGRNIVGVFSQQPTHLEVAPKLLVICGLAQIPFALAIVTRGSLYGAGDTRVVMVMTLITIWAIRLPMAWVFSGVDIPLWNGKVIPNPAPLQRYWDVEPLIGLWFGLCGELVLRPIFFMARFIQGGWKTVRV